MKPFLKIAPAIMLLLAIGFGLGRWWPGEADMAGASSGSERDILYWKAPMDPNYRRDKPGKSPMGMDLVPVYADEVNGEDPAVVAIDPTVVSNLGVRTETVAYGPLSRQINTVGYVGYDEDSWHEVNTRVEGWVEKLSIKASGEPVQRGQVLFELYAPTIVNAQEEYLAALKSRNPALHAASRERLAALGMTASEIRRLDKERTVKRRTRVYASTDGVVARLNVREGIFVTPATPVMSIANLDRVWVLAEVFERQAAWVEQGQRAEITLDYLPGQRMRGTVDYVYPELDPKTRTLKVRLRLDNPAMTLRPNMFARVRIQGTPTDAVVHVPQESLIRGGAVNRVVLAQADGKFRSQPVEVGIEAGSRVAIQSGLTAGDRVVTSGQFLIDSESNIESALARMEVGGHRSTPGQVRVGAVVRGVDVAASTVRLEHAPIAEWSWPSMTMNFDVTSAELLAGLSVGDEVEVTIEKHSDNHYVITGIKSAHATRGSDHQSGSAATEAEDHSHHTGETQ